MDHIKNLDFLSSKNPHININEQIINAFEKTADLSGKISGKRKIEQGTIGKRTSLFPSYKNQAMIPLESKLELAYALSLEQNKNVEAYRTQAIQIPHFKNRFLFPDFIIKYKDGSYAVHEIKPSIQHLNEKQLLKLTIVEKTLQHQNIVFCVIDQTSLIHQDLLQEVLFFYSKGHSQVWSHELILNAKACLNFEYDNLNDLYKVLIKNNFSRNLGDYFIFHKIIAIKELIWN